MVVARRTADTQGCPERPSPTRDFGPLAFKAVRKDVVDRGLSRVPRPPDDRRLRFWLAGRFPGRIPAARHRREPTIGNVATPVRVSCQRASGPGLHEARCRPIQSGLPTTGPQVLKHRAKNRVGPKREFERNL